MFALPNPDTYLNHLSPSEATQFEVARNLCLAVLGAALWDIFIYIPDDIGIFRRGPVHFATLCFVLSRLFAVTLVLLAVIEHTIPVVSCSGLEISIGAVCALAIACTSFLFLQRVRAIYAHNRWVQGVFILLWLAYSAIMSAAPFASISAHIPGTGYCTYTHVDRYLVAAAFMVLSFDTLVFLAISYQIASSHSSLDVGITWATLVSGRALPRLSRAILQGGQQYYLLTICLNLPLAILNAVPSTPPIYKLMLGYASVPLTASMACRVFRHVKTYDLQIQTQTLISNVIFATLPPTHNFTSRPPDITHSVTRSQVQNSSGTPSQTQDAAPRVCDTAEQQVTEVRFPCAASASEASRPSTHCEYAV